MREVDGGKQIDIDDGSMFMTKTKKNLDELPIHIVEDDMVLESMSSDEDTHETNFQKSHNQGTLNRQERMILVPIKGTKLTDEDKQKEYDQMVKDQNLFEELVHNIKTGDNSWVVQDQIESNLKD